LRFLLSMLAAVRGHDNAATVDDTAHRHLQCYCCCCCCCVWLLLLLLPLLVPRLWVLCCCWLPGWVPWCVAVGRVALAGSAILGAPMVRLPDSCYCDFCCRCLPRRSCL
jgi:hypothetical protein